MSDNMNVDISFTVDQAKVNQAKAAAASVSAAFGKAAAEIGRSRELDNLSKKYARLAVEGQDAIEVTKGLNDALTKLGASDKEIEKTVKAFDRQVDAIERSNKALSQREADESTRLGRFERVEETSGKVGDVGDAFAALGSATGIQALGDFGAIFEGIEALARAKAGLEALPESLTATAKAALAAKTATTAAAAAETASVASSTAATAANTGQAAADTTEAATSLAAAGGTLAFVAAMAPIAVVGAAVAAVIGLIVAGLAALKAQSDETNAAMTRAYEANRDVQEAIIEGATREDAIEEVRKTTLRIKNETENLSKAKADNDKLFADIQAKYGDIFARIANLLGLGGFAANSKEIETATQNVKENQATLKEWNDAIKNNETAYNDAKKAAEEQEKANEKAAREAEQASEKSAREAEQQAQRIQQAQENIAKAQENYANKQVDIARQAAERIDDINRSNRDRQEDSLKKYNLDLTKIAQDARDKEVEAARKSAQAEYDARVDTNRKLEDLRDNALESEQDAVNSRNFLQQTKIREGLEKANKEALKDFDRASEDRKRAEEIETAERYTAIERARRDRMEGYRQEQIDNQTNINRQLRDARIAKDRQINEAQIAYNRELETLQAYLASLGAINASFYQQQFNMAQQAAGVASGASGGSSVPLSSGTLSGPGSFTPGKLGGLRPIPNAPAARAGNTVHLSIYANDEQAIYNGVKRLGLID